MPTVFAITVSYGPVPGLADVRLRAEVEDVRLVRRLAQLLDEVVDRRLVGQVGEVHLQPAAQVPDVVQRAARGRAHERVHVRAELDERVGQVRAHEAVGARDEHRPAAVDVAELARGARRAVGSSQAGACPAHGMDSVEDTGCRKPLPSASMQAARVLRAGPRGARAPAAAAARARARRRLRRGRTGRSLREAGASWISGVELDPEPRPRGARRYDEVRAGRSRTSSTRSTGPFDTILALRRARAPRRSVGAAAAAARGRGAGRARCTSPSRTRATGRSCATSSCAGRSATREAEHRDVTHLRWFTRRDLVELLEATGWSVDGVSFGALRPVSRSRRGSRGAGARSSSRISCRRSRIVREVRRQPAREPEPAAARAGGASAVPKPTVASSSGARRRRRAQPERRARSRSRSGPASRRSTRWTASTGQSSAAIFAAERAAGRDAVLRQHVAAPERLEPPRGRRGRAERLPVLVERARVAGESRSASPPRGSAARARRPPSRRRASRRSRRAPGRRPAGRRPRRRTGPTGRRRRRQLGHGPVPEVVPRARASCRARFRPSRRARARRLQQHARDEADGRILEGRGDPLDELRLADDVVVHEHEHVAVGGWLQRAPRG